MAELQGVESTRAGITKLKVTILRLMDTFLCFSAVFTKGNNFCNFICFHRQRSPVKSWGLTPKESGGRKVSCRVASPESIPINAYNPKNCDRAA